MWRVQICCRLNVFHPPSALQPGANQLKTVHELYAALLLAIVPLRQRHTGGRPVLQHWPPTAIHAAGSCLYLRECTSVRPNVLDIHKYACELCVCMFMRACTSAKHTKCAPCVRVCIHAHLYARLCTCRTAGSYTGMLYTYGLVAIEACILVCSASQATYALLRLTFIHIASCQVRCGASYLYLPPLNLWGVPYVDFRTSNPYTVSV